MRRHTGRRPRAIRAVLCAVVLTATARNRRGVRHGLTSLLMAAVAAVLAGATSFTAVGEWVADAPPQVLAALGVRDPLTRLLCRTVTAWLSLTVKLPTWPALAQVTRAATRVSKV